MHGATRGTAGQSPLRGMGERSTVRLRDYGRRVTEDFWSEVAEVAWPSAPSGFRHGGSVPSALRQLSDASDETSANAAYHLMLDAIGHDHAGLLFPAALPAVPFLVRLALEAEPWARHAAIQVLIDVLCWAADVTQETSVGISRATLMAPVDLEREAIAAVAATATLPQLRVGASELLTELRP